MKVIISGERAWEMIAADATRYAGVDLIGTDDLAGLQEFLLKSEYPDPEQ